MNNPALDAILTPKSVAVVGASATPGKIGYTVVNNLIKDGYQGKIFPINPTATEILGLKVYASVIDVPEDDRCRRHHRSGQICCRCGRRMRQEGHQRPDRHHLRLWRIRPARPGRRDRTRLPSSTTARILGPNIVGVLSNSYKMNASFAPFLPLNGKASLISQSGALLIAIDAATYVRKVGFNKLISIGNMSDVDFADLIEWLNEDEDTTCITLYIEGLKDGRRFMDVSRKATQTDHRHQIRRFRARRGGGGFAHRLAGRRGQGLQRRFPAGGHRSGL